MLSQAAQANKLFKIAQFLFQTIVGESVLQNVCGLNEILSSVLIGLMEMHDDEDLPNHDISER